MAMMGVRQDASPRERAAAPRASASKICDRMFGALKATGVECVEFDMYMCMKFE